MEKNYYDILGVNKDASKDDIRRAFKKLSVKYHPDKHINDSEEDKKKAEEKFKEINEAYEVLSDDKKRQEYDNPIPEGFGFGFDPFGFGNFFTGRQAYHNFEAKPGQDIRVTINLNMEDFYKGGIKEIHYKKNIRCGHCNGEGGDTKICPHCHGNGVIEHRQVQGNMTFVNQVQCNYCNGTGKIVTNACPNCNGTGFIKEDKVFRLNIDDIKASTETGDYVLDLSGGHESKYSGGRDGQLIGRLIINRGNYKVDQSNNVFEQVEIPYYDMLLGTDKDVTLPNGKKITVKIPTESKDGSLVKSPKNGINGGDYYLCIKAKFPSLNKNDKELLKKIKTNHS